MKARDGNNLHDAYWATVGLGDITMDLGGPAVARQHYETITGADTLALALVELHLSILHITAVRCPPNTIDR